MAKSVPCRAKEILYCYAYPCSVESFVDPLEYAEKLLERPYIELDEIVKSLGGCDREVTTAEDVRRLATSLRDKWNYNTVCDRTSMKSDCDIIQTRWSNAVSHFIDEFRHERITEVRGLLRCQQADVDVLYLIGHGLSEKMAKLLRDYPADDGSKKSKRWKWPLYDCEVQDGRGALPSKVTGDAKKGDLVVFSSGFLSPEWVVEQLKQRDDTCGSENTIVIVIDSCYSGKWHEVISDKLTESPLQNTRVLLQTASGPDEVAYGYFFTPLFCALQDVPPAVVETCASLVHHSPVVPQSPLFFDSSKPDGYPNLPTVRVEVGGSGFRFFNQCAGSDFFRKFAHYYPQVVFGTEARDIPKSDLAKIFRLFGTPSIAILCFKLKTHKKAQTPMAFILIEWLRSDSTSRHYHLHLHFGDFQSMNLTTVRPVDVTKCPYGSYVYMEQIDTHSPKQYISPVTTSSAVWNNITQKLLPAAEEFVYKNGIGVSWNNPESWTMSECQPPNMIKSRSAVFEEVQPNNLCAD